ncbi:MAG TPA: glycosyltransferase [Trebonia sp.]|jgi:glycosyltransferase involved in cell wall biosynthesis|nr:glycosyltransferase [Trebonia sp.]
MDIALVAQHATPFPVADASEDDASLRELCLGLAAAEHRVTVYSGRPGEGPPDGQRRRISVEYLGADPCDSESELLARIPDFAASLRDRLDGDRPEVVHALRWTSGLSVLAATRDLGIPVVQSFASLGVAERRHRLLPRSIGAKRIRLERALGRSVRAVVAASSDEESDLAKIGVPRHAISVVPCAVDTDVFTPVGPVAARGDRPRLVTMTRLAYTEELAIVLRALAYVPGAELIVASGPPKEELPRDPAYRELSSLAERLGVVDRVTFTGRMSAEDVPPLLRSADLSVDAAGYDPTGMLTLQSMACGTPVVVAGAGGQADAVVDGATGIVVPIGRPAVMAHRIRRMLSHPMLLQGCGVAAVDRVQARHSRARIATETAAVYGKAVDIAG